MKIEDYKDALRELSPDDLTTLLRNIRTSRAKPKASNIKRRAKAEAAGTKNKPVTKNQVLNLINGMSEEDASKLLSLMEESQ